MKKQSVERNVVAQDFQASTLMAQHHQRSQQQQNQRLQQQHNGSTLNSVSGSANQSDTVQSINKFAVLQDMDVNDERERDLFHTTLTT